MSPMETLVHQLVHEANGTSVMDCWLAAHAEMVSHWEELHPNDVGAPGPCCLPLVREEALRFARVERQYPDGLVTALEEWGDV